MSKVFARLHSLGNGVVDIQSRVTLELVRVQNVIISRQFFWMTWIVIGLEKFKKGKVLVGFWLFYLRFWRGLQVLSTSWTPAIKVTRSTVSDSLSGACWTGIMRAEWPSGVYRIDRILDTRVKLPKSGHAKIVENWVELSSLEQISIWKSSYVQGGGVLQTPWTTATQ